MMRVELLRGIKLKYALFSDVHGNWEAFTALEKALRAEAPDKVFLGDIVGYGPDPKACIELLKETQAVALAGNHDHAAAGITDISYFNPLAKEAVLWTQTVLSPEDIAYLKSLAIKVYVDEMCLAHATPYQPLSWQYIATLTDAKFNFEHFSGQLCFIGHSHEPVFIAATADGRCYVHREQLMELSPQERYIINVGSVGQPRDGQPRDGNPQSSYAIYDSSRNTVELKRISYDAAVTQRKILAAGLPEYLASRLELGY